MSHNIKIKDTPIIMVIALQDAITKKYSYAYKEIDLKDFISVNTNATTAEESQAYAVKAIQNKYGENATDILIAKPLNN